MNKQKITKFAKVSFPIVVVLLFAWMGWRIYWLEVGATEQFMWHQYDLTRINNLKGCLEHQDLACPESKYADSKSALEKISEYDSTLPFSR